MKKNEAPETMIASFQRIHSKCNQPGCEKAPSLTMVSLMTDSSMRTESLCGEHIREAQLQCARLGFVVSNNGDYVNVKACEGGAHIDLPEELDPNFKKKHDC